MINSLFTVNLLNNSNILKYICLTLNKIHDLGQL